MNIRQFVATIIMVTTLLVVMPALALLVVMPALAQSQITHQNLLPYEQGLDLESGSVFTKSLDLCALFGNVIDCAGVDLYFAFSSLKTNPFVLFQNQSEFVEIAFLDNTSFQQVSVNDIGDLIFTPSLIGEPFDFDDTIVLFTGDDNFFKIGNAVCFSPEVNIATYPDCQIGPPGSFSIIFDYQRLVEPPRGRPDNPGPPH
jgi:hypothetical protein